MTRQQSAAKTAWFLSFLNSVISFSQLRSALVINFDVSEDFLVVYEILNLVTVALAQQKVSLPSLLMKLRKFRHFFSWRVLESAENFIHVSFHEFSRKIRIIAVGLLYRSYKLPISLPGKILVLKTKKSFKRPISTGKKTKLRKPPKCKRLNFKVLMVK